MTPGATLDWGAGSSRAPFCAPGGDEAPVTVRGHEGLEGNPYDGHTLKATLDQVSALTSVEP